MIVAHVGSLMVLIVPHVGNRCIDGLMIVAHVGSQCSDDLTIVAHVRN